MSSDSTSVREKFFMSAQGERLFTISLGVCLAGVITSVVVGCVEEGNKVPVEIQALEACNTQPYLTVRTFSGTESAPGTYSDSQLSAVERDKYVVDAVAKCRTDVLEYLSKAKPSIPVGQ